MNNYLEIIACCPLETSNDWPMKILVTEDNPDVRHFLTKGLREVGHTVSAAEDGKTALKYAQDTNFDIMIIDRMLPNGVDGIEIVEALRSKGCRTPVLFLSALDKIDERVRGLRAGGGDYLTKPFAFEELLARIEALHSRTQIRTEETLLSVGDIELDLLSRSVKRGARVISLQQREFQILEYLMRRAGQVVTRTMLLSALWSYQFDPTTNVIDVHIARLRRKLDNGHEPSVITTMRNAGYVFSSDHTR